MTHDITTGPCLLECGSSDLAFAPGEEHNIHMAEPAFNIDDLSPEERLSLLEQLWDSLTADPGAVPFTAAQRDELDHRLDEIDRGDVEGIPWEEVVRQIHRRRR